MSRLTFTSKLWFDCGRDNAAGVEVSVISFMLLGLMEGPVLIKIMASSQRAKTQDGLCAIKAPAGAGHFHAVLDQMAAGAFNDSCGDREALSK